MMITFDISTYELSRIEVSDLAQTIASMRNVLTVSRNGQMLAGRMHVT